MPANASAMQGTPVMIVASDCARIIVTTMLVHATTVSASVTRDGVAHIVPFVNASGVAYTAVVIMVCASVLQDGVVPIVTSKTVLLIVTEMDSVSTVSAHVNQIGPAHHVINVCAQDYVVEMVSASKRMPHACVSMNSQGLRATCANAQRK